MKKILIVEDEVLIGMMLVEKIQALGFQTCELATSAEEAFELVKEEQPDGIVLDISLAGQMDGISAAEEIQEISDIPFLFFTGYRDAQLIQRAQKTNPVAILDKMGPLEELQDALKKMFEESS